MSITLQFVREPGIASSAIAWFTEGHYSHVDALNDAGWCLGARLHGGVLWREPGYAYFVRRTLVRFTATPHQQRAFWTFLDSQVGLPYDSSAI